MAGRRRERRAGSGPGVDETKIAARAPSFDTACNNSATSSLSACLTPPLSVRWDSGLGFRG
jgi:hypothetical protein